MRSSPEPGDSAAARVGRLLHALDLQSRGTLKAADPEHVHGLRVAARRFSQALYVFESSIDRAERIRRELKPLTDAAGGVRDFDIAAKFLAKDDDAGGAKIATKLEQERSRAQSRLAMALEKFSRGHAIERWSGRIAKPTRAADPSRAVLATARAFFRRGKEAGSSKR